MKESTCKGCGKKIVWGKTGDGKAIPLDPKPPIYYTKEMPDGETACVKFTSMEEGVDYMVSHFATCSKANEFSASKK